MSARNSLSDLNNHLFEQLERLNDEALKGDKLNEEIQRSQAVTKVAKEIINNGRLVLAAQRFSDEKWDADTKLPQMLEARNE